ncbi:MAG TPA: Flp family type IVb pilin [Chloroflexi bacterium]|jgi:pilus assembly protein Flp/PilA|nr:Flp family type IVb pilin [Chloroflexota bacterium]
MLFAPKEKGQGLVEYALILVLVAIVVIAILAILGPAIGNVFSNVVSAI